MKVFHTQQCIASRSRSHRQSCGRYIERVVHNRSGQTVLHRSDHPTALQDGFGKILLKCEIGPHSSMRTN